MDFERAAMGHARVRRTARRPSNHNPLLQGTWEQPAGVPAGDVLSTSQPSSMRWSQLLSRPSQISSLPGLTQPLRSSQSPFSAVRPSASRSVRPSSILPSQSSSMPLRRSGM